MGLKVCFERRYGPCSLAVVFARVGRVPALVFALDRGADLGSKDRDGATALH